MKLYSITALSTLLVSAVSAGSFFQQAAGLHEYLGVGVGTTQGRSVPGDSPLFFCGDTSRDIATIERVDLSPNPPVAGEILKISALGSLSDMIAPGAKVDITVKYGLITLLKESLDLCDNAGQVDLECPVEQGKLVIKKNVEIPKQIPPGQYTVVANAYTVDMRPITCLTATIKFYAL